MTSRDQELLRLLGRSQGLAQIADTLGVNYKRVANTCSGIKAKLGAPRWSEHWTVLHSTTNHRRKP